MCAGGSRAVSVRRMSPMSSLRDEIDSSEFRSPVSLWRNWDYLLLWSSQVVSVFGSQVSLVAFPLLALAITGSPAQTGFMSALRSVPFIFLVLPAGALVDRWDRKRTMIVCDTGRALVLGSIPLALATGH